MANVGVGVEQMHVWCSQCTRGLFGVHTVLPLTQVHYIMGPEPAANAYLHIATHSGFRGGSKSIQPVKDFRLLFIELKPKTGMKREKERERKASAKEKRKWGRVYEESQVRSRRPAPLKNNNATAIQPTTVHHPARAQGSMTARGRPHGEQLRRKCDLWE